jgi:OOP family OmpA-OmpF porin
MAAHPLQQPQRSKTQGKSKMNKTTALQLCLLAGLAPALPAAAQTMDDGGYFYGGLTGGTTRAKIDQDSITSGLANSGLGVTSFNHDERGNAFGIFGGYQMNRYFGLEAGYVDMGEFGYSATTSPPGTLNGRILLQGLHLDLVGTLPLSSSLSLIGRVGVQNTRARDNFDGSGAVTVTNPNPSTRSNQALFGGGLQYEFSPSFLMRAEAQRVRVNDAVGHIGSVNMVSVSLVVPFGRKPAPAPRAAAPAYVAPAPAPMPPPVVMAEPAPVVAPPPPPRRVSFTAESLFGFDQSVIQPAGKAALDTFAAETRSTQFSQITVEGHTDRLGTPAYNQRLSEQRAEAVKAYLVNPGGVDASKVMAVGKGETMPVTKAEDCPQRQPRAKLIVCLQPDRRVEIEVSGTR